MLAFTTMVQMPRYSAVTITKQKGTCSNQKSIKRRHFSFSFEITRTDTNGRMDGRKKNLLACLCIPLVAVGDGVRKIVKGGGGKGSLLVVIVSVYCRDPSRLTAQFFVLRYLLTHFLLTPSPSETFHSTVLLRIDPCQNKHYQLPCLRYQNSLLVPPAVLPALSKSFSVFILANYAFFFL